MRAHGVLRYSDPDSDGQLPKGGAERFGVSTTAFQAAQRASQHLLPDPGGSFARQFQQCVQGGVCPQAVGQQALALQQKFAQCIRAYGVPKFPDPESGPNEAPYFPVSAAGLSCDYKHLSQFRSKKEECQHEVGGSVPVSMG
jgi:hypothetical protein